MKGPESSWEYLDNFQKAFRKHVSYALISDFLKNIGFDYVKLDKHFIEEFLMLIGQRHVTPNQKKLILFLVRLL